MAKQPIGRQKTLTSSRAGRCVPSILLLFFSTLAALSSGEIVLRLMNIPGVDFNNTRYDKIVGATYYPGSLLSYRNDRGVHLQRRINAWGYPDAEHEIRKNEGMYRIGFFGDSYTESIQVNLQHTYFRLVPAILEEEDLECLAFGHTGFGTLHAFLESQRWASVCDLDLVIYVFCENYLADNIIDISGNTYFPSAVLTPDGFEVDNSFRELHDYKRSLYFRTYDYLTAHSLLFATLASRVKLILRYGIKPTVTEEDRMMTTRMTIEDGDGTPPAGTDLPSGWSAEWRTYGTRLGEAIILEWKRQLEENQTKYAILYVPRPGEMEKEAAEQDSWKQWLVTLCEENSIPLLDPTPDLLAAQRRGEEVFYDHYAYPGHKAVAKSIIRELGQIR